MAPEKRKSTSKLDTIPIMYPTLLPRQTNAAVAANKATKTRNGANTSRGASRPWSASVTNMIAAKSEERKGMAISGDRLWGCALGVSAKP